MSAASRKGQRFERLMADWLRDRLNDDRIDIRPKNGQNDRGDLGAITTVNGSRVVAELKSHNRYEISAWLDEAERERGNDDAAVGVVVFKRPRYGKAEDQLVVMTAESFAVLLEGGVYDHTVVVRDPHVVLGDTA